MGKSFKYLKTAFESFLAFISGIILLTSIAVFMLFWKLHQGPVDLTWAQSYIQDALGGDRRNVTVHAGGIVAEWRDFSSPLALGIADLRISENGEEILHLSQAGLQIAKAPLFLGIVSPEAIYIRKPDIRFIKTEDGRLSFLIADKNAMRQELDNNPDDTPSAQLAPEEIADSLFLGSLLKDDGRLPLSRLKSVVITGATIRIDDRTQNRAFVLPDANLSVNRDTNNVSIDLDYRGAETDRPRMNAVMTRKALTNKTSFLVRLHNLETGLWALHMPSLPGLMREDYHFDGKVKGRFGKEWSLETLTGAIATSYHGKEQQDFSFSAVRDAQGLIPLKLSVPRVTLNQISEVWPEQFRQLNIAEWFTEKLSVGTIRDLEMTLPFRNIEGRWEVAGNLSGGFAFENLTCDYRAPLYPLTGGYGHAKIADNTLSIFVDRAKLDALNVEQGKIVINKLIADEAGEAKINLHLNGPLETAFRYVALEPIRLGDKLKTDPAKVKGEADIKVHVEFPTVADLPADAVKVTVDAMLQDTALPGIVKGMDLTGGPLALKVEGGAFSISGKGALQGRDIDFSYKEYLNPDTAPFATEVSARLIADDDIRKKLGVDLSDYIAGPIGINIAYQENAAGVIEASVAADLTPGETFVAPLNYKKAKGVSGKANAKLTIEPAGIRKIRDFNIAIGPDVATGGELDFKKIAGENTVSAARFTRVRLGEDNDFALKLDQDTQALRMTIEGKSLDARGFMGGEKEKEPRPRDVDMLAKTERLRMGDLPDQVFLSPQLRVVANPAGEMKLLALKAKTGRGKFSIDLAPDTRGVMNMRMDATDAGGSLRIIGAYRDMVGGKLSLSGMQTPDGKLNDIQGAAVIEDFSIVRAPALAKLIGAFSITGLPEALANDGISFEKLRTDFIWREGQRGRIINFYEGTTSGGSIGLTFGGVINQTNETMNLSGTFVPISGINRMVGSIPLIGQILTGGKNGGIIAASYTIKGPTKNPSVRINPLSVLAPGFLRSILFEGGMGSGRDEKPVGPSRPAPR